MIVYLLDSDHIGIIQRQSEPEFSNLTSRLLDTPSQSVFVSIISFHEQMAGWQRYLNQAKSPEGVVLAYAMFQQILTDFVRAQVLPYDHAASLQYQALRSSRLRIGTLDLRIAAIALSRGYVVVTRNTVDFGRVPNLRLEDWTRRSS